MESFLYILVFVFIVFVKYFFDKKLKETDVRRFYKTKRTVPYIRKKVRIRQKIYRKSNKKPFVAFSQVEREISAKIYENSEIQTQRFTQDSAVSENRKRLFNKKTLKDAVIFKEILDLPVALR
jgi:hypothetical protein